MSIAYRGVLNKLKARQNGQLKIPFDFDDKAHTIEIIEKPKVNLSGFNKKLKQGLDFNPK